ncbi:alpha/beta hydrolase family protein [Paenibacillus alkalitolerans]|uniref:alpha/beta hydrolase family protein n=1 Tax=Paenibacillus alkalitolerans TaxID=2799335 RepID=UPI0018F2C51C|nr:alpha/beta fold hydrolase [Paenibacillus alkalitolerans]
MREFEAALLVMNLLALFVGPSRKLSKSVLLGIAGLNGVMLCLHGVIEGFRYQMMFAYMFVLLFAVYAAVKAKIRFSETKFTKILKGTAVGMSALLLAATSLAAYALPVFKLPAPTGDYAVGVQYVYLTDETREEPFLDGSTARRELPVKIYYPAIEDKTKPYTAYFHDSPALIEAFASGYQMPAGIFSHLRLVKTHSREGPAVSDQQASYPLILFSHGGGTTMEVHTSQCEDLASHGYIVAAINHTYVSSATELPGRIVTDRDATVHFEGDPLASVTQIMADDVSFVIDKLTEMNDGKTDSIFESKLNLEQVGVVGHSLGGAAAYNLALNESRVKAAINLDGAVYIARGTKPIAPFVMLANDEYGLEAIMKGEPFMIKLEDMPAEEREAVASAYGGKEAYMDIYKKQEQAMTGLAETLKASDSLYVIEGSAHMKFTDIGLYIGAGFHRFIGINGDTSSEECLDIAKSVTLAFFNRQLKNETRDSLESVLRKYPKLQKASRM